MKKIRIELLKSAVAMIPGGAGRSIGLPKGRIAEVDAVLAKSLIKGGIAIKTTKELKQEKKAIATQPTQHEIDLILKNEPIVIKRPPATSKEKPKKQGQKRQKKQPGRNKK